MTSARGRSWHGIPLIRHAATVVRVAVMRRKISYRIFRDSVHRNQFRMQGQHHGGFKQRGVFKIDTGKRACKNALENSLGCVIPVFETYDLHLAVGGRKLTQRKINAFRQKPLVLDMTVHDRNTTPAVPRHFAPRPSPSTFSRPSARIWRSTCRTMSRLTPGVSRSMSAMPKAPTRRATAARI